ncbi:MAG TPA: AAA family ATPase [Urbifossiella sp.]|jgi:predicted kinase|nr:AAA family ATPase [Urbifossiella sp.]
MLVAMAGLPGTGKSALAARLAAALGGVVLSKDVVRAALFPGPALDYSADQDDLAVGAVFAAAAYLRRVQPGLSVLLDGRTYSKAAQVRALHALGEEVGEPVRVIECVCPADVARARIARDHAAGIHPAGNRTPDLHDRSRAAADPLILPRLMLDTAALTPDECERAALAYLGRGPE